MHPDDHWQNRIQDRTRLAEKHAIIPDAGYIHKQNFMTKMK